MDEVNAFLDDLLGEVDDLAHADGEGRIRHHALVSVLLSRLEDAGMCENPQPAHFRYERGAVSAEVHGYAVDPEDDLLTLFYVVDATADRPFGQSLKAPTTPKTTIDRGLRRLLAFVKLARANKHEIEDSLPAAELAAMIRDISQSNVRLVLHVLTTGRLTDRAISVNVDHDLECEMSDVVRLKRLLGGVRDGTTDVDFESEHGGALPCLVTPQTSDGLQVLLTCVPGAVLASIYDRHRAALLERNVRTFLQFAGKVNKGIRETLLNEPGRFLPYNNGLSATAREIDLTEGDGGIGHIRSAIDFQIVNGGQTTASIAAAARRDKADLSSVVVPMKLTVVPASRIDELVPKISRYANTQNRVQDSDFSANEPWHVGVERLSRGSWTRPTAAAPRGTRWFYERSRGQYRDELSACGTTASRRRYRAENPPRQKLTKTDLAKYLSSWDQLPHIVSRGAQKCFIEFMQRLGPESRQHPKPEEFHRYVALAILFRHTERLHGEMGYQGYRANVVTYTVAALSRVSSRRLDIAGIWMTQQVPDDLDSALRIILTGTREIITNPPPKYRNVTEWSKRPECWDRVVETPFDVDLKIDSGETIGFIAEPPPAGVLVATADEEKIITAVANVSTEIWFALASWAKQTDNLVPWQRNLASSLGKLTLNGDLKPSAKSARQGGELLLEAVRLGFIDEKMHHDLIELVRKSIARDTG